MCHDEAVMQGADNGLESYVRAALRLQGYDFDETQIADVVLQFSRLHEMAQIAAQSPLPFAARAAAVFRP